jgi:sugar-phosphatase
MARAVIFDMDGLLIDSEPLWVRAEIETFASVGLVLSEADCARTKGLRIDDVIAYWHARSERGFSGTAPAVVQERLVGRVAELVATEGTALRGVESALEAARGWAGRIALASSSPSRIIEAALARLGLKASFDAVLSAEKEPFGKPHPAIFLRAAERLAVGPLDCVVIEDSMNGVIAAKAARMGCVAVPFDHPNHEARFALADVVLPSLTELTSRELGRACPTE